MRRILGYSLWIGHAGVLRDPAMVADSGVRAVVDLALNEPPAVVRRELVACRFPLIDGEGNPPWLLQAAAEAVAGLVRDGIPTLVCCGNGMSRSPAIAAAAMALARGISPDEALELATRGGPADVSPALWRDVLAAVSPGRVRP